MPRVTVARAPSNTFGFSDIACGSAAELETQFLLSNVLGYLDQKASDLLLESLAEVERRPLGSSTPRSLRSREQAAKTAKRESEGFGRRIRTVGHAVHRGLGRASSLSIDEVMQELSFNDLDAPALAREVNGLIAHGVLLSVAELIDCSQRAFGGRIFAAALRYEGALFPIRRQSAPESAESRGFASAFGCSGAPSTAYRSHEITQALPAWHVTHRCWWSPDLPNDLERTDDGECRNDDNEGGCCDASPALSRALAGSDLTNGHRSLWGLYIPDGLVVKPTRYEFWGLTPTPGWRS